MALTQVTGPYPIFTDLDGTPLDDGYLYIGAINQDPEQNPIQVFWDANLTIEATQPIRTSNGYAYRNGTPALLYTAGEFSITIRNKRNEFVLYSPVGYGFDPAAVSASVVKNDFIGNGVQVAFVLSAAPSTILATNIFINGVYQEKDSYTLSGNTITFSIAPPLNSSIEVMTNETGVINSGNATAITYTLTAAGAVQQTVQTKLEQYVSVDDFGAIPDGTTDSGPAIRVALASGLPLRFQKGTYIVGPDPASENTGGIGPGLFGWCINVPSNTTMIFDEGSVIKGANGLKSWCRVMQFGSVDNIKVFGEMSVDANVANISSPNNEHMHGVIIYDLTNFYFEAIKSINARGDNVYIGGTDNTRGTSDGYIGRIVAETAGRKNLVWQSFDNINIGSASLDNTNGGAAIYGGVPDGTDGNSFDVEPDAFSGAVPNRGTINYLSTRGAGNDFTAGVTETGSNGMVISIGKWDCVIVSRSTTPWYLQNAITLNIDEWNVSGITAVSPQAEIFYAARLNVGKCTIRGATANINTALMLIGVVGTNRPVCTFGTLQITTTQGFGFEVRSGQVTIDYYRARTAGLALWARELGSSALLYTDVKIGKLELLDIGVPLGAGYAVLLSKGATNTGYLHIDQIVHQDTRTPDLNYIVFTSGAGASAGLYIGSVVNLTPAVAVQGGDAADIYYSTAANAFVSVNDPEGSVVAPVGSIASWFGNGLYKKDTGTGNTGWVAL
jgi:hypothetical protein